jgi:uncharacterized protein (TIGR02145 family)
VNPLPVITSFTASPDTICVGQSSVLTVSATDATSYSFFDQGSWGATTTKTVSPTESSTFTVYAKDDEGCIVSGYVEVTVNERPEPSFTFAPTGACSADSVTLEATGGGSYCFTVVCNTCIRNPYLAGNDDPGAADCEVLDTECEYNATNTFTFQMPESGDVTVWVKVKNDNGCIDSARTTIQVIDCNANLSGCAPSTLSLGTVGFKSTSTYTQNGLIMSSAVTVTYCAKTAYSGTATGGLFNADCRSNDYPVGQLFSWCMVQQYADVLCPSDWRVPTKEDFCKIANGGDGSNCSTGSRGNDFWWEYGNHALADGTLYPSPRDEFGDYWSLSEYDLWRGYSADAREDEDKLDPAVNADKSWGLILRCVKDAP